jgi:filamentous hemagglutinin
MLFRSPIPAATSRPAATMRPAASGGGRVPEEYIPGSGPGTRGGTFVDVTATNGNSTIRVQTIDTYANGQPTAREAAAAQRIRNAFPSDELRLVPKN